MHSSEWGAGLIILFMIGSIVITVLFYSQGKSCSRVASQLDLIAPTCTKRCFQPVGGVLGEFLA